LDRIRVRKRIRKQDPYLVSDVVIVTEV
jgi:hypothetical protein